MSGRGILFFSLIIFGVGSTIGFIAGSSVQKQLPAKPPTVDAFDSAEKDPTIPLQNKIDQLILDYQKLSDRVGILENKTAPKVLSASVAKVEEKKIVPEVQTKVFVEPIAASKKPKEPESKLAFYERANQRMMPLLIPAATLGKLFTNKDFNVVNMKNIGIQTEPLDDAKRFLKNHVCLEPSFSVMTDDQKSLSEFFERVRKSSFRGETLVSSGSKKLSFKTTFLFNSNAHNDFDYIATSDDKKNFLERRIIDNDNDNSTWRFNSCQPSVVLPSDRCPWNDKFSQEFKDVYVSPDSKHLIGNIYCKNPTDPKWTPVGTFELDQSIAEAE